MTVLNLKYSQINKNNTVYESEKYVLISVTLCYRSLTSHITAFWPVLLLQFHVYYSTLDYTKPSTHIETMKELI